MSKRIISILTTIAMVISLVGLLPAVTAGALTYGEYEYTVLGDGTVEITDYHGNATTLAISSTIDGKAVTSIGDYAFSWCDRLTSIAIPNSVTSIGENAFYYCTSLTSITIPDSVTSIEDFGCTSLTEINVDSNNRNYSSKDGVLFNYNKTELIKYPSGKTQVSYTIPNSVKRIGGYAFAESDSLTSVIIGNNVTSIGDEAFSACTSLTNVTIPNSVISIGDYAFDGCSSLTSITIPNSVTSIGRATFYGCSNLTSITMPNSVTSIGGYAFSETSWLKNKQKENPLVVINGILIDGTTYSEENLTIPNSVTSIGDEAFYGCDLTSVTIPDSVSNIGDGAFNFCNLTSITIPNSVTSIGDNAFGECNSLTEINVDSNNKNYSSQEGVLFNYDKTELIIYPKGKSQTTYTIPDSVTSIGDYAFSGCESLTNVTIPNSVISIGDYAFYSCMSLTSITIGNSVTSIGDWAFSFCMLTSVTIGNSVISIGDSAFVSCTSLKSVTIPDNVTSIGNFAFWYCTDLTSITIPDSITNIGHGAFMACTSLTSVTIPNSVTSIGNDAFEACTSLTEINVDSNNNYYSSEDGVLFNFDKTELIKYPDGKTQTSYTIPNSVTSIGNDAFWYCTSLTSITIGNSVASIGDEVFDYCLKLTEINVDSDNNDYLSQDGVLFNYNKTELIKYPAGKTQTTYTIPDSVKSIGYHAFYICESLTSVTIPKTVTEIREMAFGFYLRLLPPILPPLTGGDYRGKYDVKIYCYSGTAGEQYAKDNEFDYELLDGNNSSQNTTNNSNNNTTNSSQNPNNNQSNKLNSNTNKQNPTTAPTISKSPAIKKAKIKNLNAKAKGKKITVSWKKINNAKGYQIQAATNKKFKKKQILFDKKTKKKKITIKGNKIKKNRIYYIRVRAYTTSKNADGKPKYTYSKWTKKNVKTN